jgi:hypothetical protein
VGKSGALTGYHWGLMRKRAMLGWEAGQGRLDGWFPAHRISTHRNLTANYGSCNFVLEFIAPSDFMWLYFKFRCQ